MKIDNIRVGKEKDKRIKIQKEDYTYIKNRHNQGEAIRSIARGYNVDKRLIQFILYPERLELNRKLRKIRGGSKIYYNKDKWRITMQKHRAYKKTLL